MLQAVKPGFILPSEAAFTIPTTESGITTWVVPVGVTAISVLAIGAGGCSNQVGDAGSGGGLGYYNNYPVRPGDILTVKIGISGTPSNFTGDSYVVDANGNMFVKGGGGIPGGLGGSFIGQGGSVGGRGGTGHVDTFGTGASTNYTVNGAGGGAAAGYGGGTQYTGAGGNVLLNTQLTGYGWKSPYVQQGGGGGQGDGGPGSVWYYNDGYNTNGGSGTSGAGITIRYPGGTGSYGWGAGGRGCKRSASVPASAKGGGGAVVILISGASVLKTWPVG